MNSVFAQMGVDVGPKRVKDTAIDLGVPKSVPNMPEDGSIALGVTTASTLDMAEAYATLANHGKHGSYSLVRKATRGGEVVNLPDHDPEQAVPRVAADTTTAIMRSVVKNGTGRAAQSAGRPAAGKTGTAEEDKAAWFAGYTPDLATVISVMGQDSKSGVQKPLYGAGGESRVNGGGFPAEIWGAYTKTALKGRPVKDFKLETNGNADLPSTQPPRTNGPTTTPPGTDTPDTPTNKPTNKPTDDPSTPEPPPTTPTIPPTPTDPGIGGVDGGNVNGGNDPGGANGDPSGGIGENGVPGGGGGVRSQRSR